MEVLEDQDHNIMLDQPVPEVMALQHFLVDILMEDPELLVQSMVLVEVVLVGQLLQLADIMPVPAVVEVVAHLQDGEIQEVQEVQVDQVQMEIQEIQVREQTLLNLDILEVQVVVEVQVTPVQQEIQDPVQQVVAQQVILLHHK
jgi:hypothetical protein